MVAWGTDQPQQRYDQISLLLVSFRVSLSLPSRVHQGWWHSSPESTRVGGTARSQIPPGLAAVQSESPPGLVAPRVQSPPGLVAHSSRAHQGWWHPDREPALVGWWYLPRRFAEPSSLLLCSSFHSQLCVNYILQYCNVNFTRMSLLLIFSILLFISSVVKRPRLSHCVPDA